MAAPIGQQDRSAYIRTRICDLRKELQELLDEEAGLLGIGRSQLDVIKSECADLKRKGLHIEAVRQYRARTGLTLLEAREAVSQL